jgi:hypothetical protein
MHISCLTAYQDIFLVMDTESGMSLKKSIVQWLLIFCMILLPVIDGFAGDFNLMSPLHENCIDCDPQDTIEHEACKITDYQVSDGCCSSLTMTGFLPESQQKILIEKPGNIDRAAFIAQFQSHSTPSIYRPPIA